MSTITPHSVPVAMVCAITLYVGVSQFWVHLHRPNAADKYLAWSSFMAAGYDLAAFFAYNQSSAKDAAFFQRLQFATLCGLAFSFSHLLAARARIHLPKWQEWLLWLFPALGVFGIVERLGLTVTQASATRTVETLFGTIVYREAEVGPLFGVLFVLGPGVVVSTLWKASHESPNPAFPWRAWLIATLIPIAGLGHDLFCSLGILRNLYIAEYCWFAVLLMATWMLTREVLESSNVRLTLKLTEDRFRTTLNAIQDAVITTDLRGTIVHLNPRAEKLLAVKLEEVLSAPLSHYLELTPSETRRVVPDPVAYALGRPQNPFGDLPQMVTTDGSERRVDIGGAPLSDESGHVLGAVVVVRDLTVQHHALESLQHAKKMESVGRLASGVAHDLNNLLTPIVSYVDLLAAQAPPDSEERLYLGHIQEAANRATDVTRQLLALSRKQVLDVQTVSLPEFVNHTIPLVKQLVGEGIEVSHSLAQDAGHVRIDPGQMEQVVLNLATNARDAMPHGGKLRIQVQAAGPRELSLEVTDNGVGMTDEVASRIFEPFFTTKVRGKGTGLGLASVRGTVEQHGGSIYVDSEPGHGTSIEILLPRTEPSEQTPAQRRQTPIEVVGGHEKVLVVEDDSSVRTLISDVLTNLGYAVLLADGLAQAEAFACSEPIDLLLSDVLMPGADGPSVLQAVLKHQSIPHLFMTGHADDRLGERGFVERGTAVLRKPFTVSQLGRRVRTALDTPPRGKPSADD